MTNKSKTFSATNKTKRVIIKKSAVTSPFSQKNIFKKTSFPSAPGGNRYEWKKVETVFAAPKDGLFAIKIEASCKNAEQNKSNDDDDLRVALDGFDFGKYEQNQEQISWKGFGTSASWNGASLKGGVKTIYFFVELQKGRHTLQFFADETPVLKNIEVSEVENNELELTDLKPTNYTKSDIKGIPWLSFIFFGSLTKVLTLGVRTQSATSKKTTDGDNLKVIVNGKVRQNPTAPTSDRYKNFYFSGNLKEFDVLTITHEDLSRHLALENAVELWYDEEPEITSLKIAFFNGQELSETLKSLDIEDLRQQILGWIHLIIFWFRTQSKKYSAEFLSHAIKSNPQPLVFKTADPIVSLIKKDPVYKKILEKIKEKIKAGNPDGEIWPKDFKSDPEMKEQINFDSFDLKTALHGIRKIEYASKVTGNNTFDVEFVLFDVYDFEKKILPLLPFHPIQLFKQAAVNWIDLWEELGIINNFEIEIRLTERFNAD